MNAEIEGGSLASLILIGSRFTSNAAGSKADRYKPNRCANSCDQEASSGPLNRVDQRDRNQKNVENEN